MFSYKGLGRPSKLSILAYYTMGECLVIYPALKLGVASGACCVRLRDHANSNASPWIRQSASHITVNFFDRRKIKKSEALSRNSKIFCERIPVTVSAHSYLGIKSTRYCNTGQSVR